MSGMWIAILVSLALLASTALLHYEVLLNVSRLTPHLSIPIRSRILVVIAAVFTAHIVEVCIYAVAFYLLRDHFGYDVVPLVREPKGAARLARWPYEIVLGDINSRADMGACASGVLGHQLNRP